MQSFNLHQGSSALLISLPHDGVDIPEAIAARMHPAARMAPDTDWYVGRLYDFAKALGATILKPHHSRYVIDLNRPLNNESLYPGQNTTGLCPLLQFSGENIYLDGQAPTPEEIDSRIKQYWQPYHEALQAQIERLHSVHGSVLLWEGHSIKSQVPFLFEGLLPDFNIGTVNGTSCKTSTQNTLETLLTKQSQFSWVSNGRFKGGYITRHYANAEKNIETVQLELSQATYMDEHNNYYDATKALQLQGLIKQFFTALL
jgi:N-formylglutamate deformylase